MGVVERQARVRAYRGQITSPGRPEVAWREDRVRFWAAIAAGAGTAEAGAAAGVSEPVAYRWFRHAGGVNPRLPAETSNRYLSSGEREDIALWRAQGCGVREIARRLGRDASSYEAAGASIVSLDDGTAGEATAASQRVMAAAAACTGDRGYTGFWGWGWQWALNSCDTNLLMAAYVAGGSVTSAVGGVIAATGVGAPAGAITIAAGGLVAAGAPVVAVCQAASYEKNAIYLNAFVTGGIGCWAQ